MGWFFGLIGLVAIWVWSSTAAIIMVIVLGLAAFVDWWEKIDKESSPQTVYKPPYSDKQLLFSQNETPKKKNYEEKPKPKKITDDEMDEYSQLAAPVGQMFSIIYVDRGGKYSNRLISLISIDTDLGDVRLYAYCYHAGDERTFISTSIQAFYNPFTGVIFKNFQDAMNNGMNIHSEFMRRRKISRKKFR